MGCADGLHRSGQSRQSRRVHDPASSPRLVIEITGSRSKIVTRPLPVDDPTRRCPDISLARADLRLGASGEAARRACPDGSVPGEGTGSRYGFVALGKRRTAWRRCSGCPVRQGTRAVQLSGKLLRAEHARNTGCSPGAIPGADRNRPCSQGLFGCSPDGRAVFGDGGCLSQAGEAITARRRMPRWPALRALLRVRP